ncbi:hypothetical protein [Agromyces sp. NBRC 114283]|uniref:hypothetical protein n=1 Tax=Agromyces sp. NBRC 114283 TaxID=2994521 RepID=UPI0024A47927|nr:hypothetical protein [Agromyces sp. NBRC 114283]GLU88926.1 hypothetical protein Agsp01_11810 [Agromyces sp. NBRC 114283]
MKLEEAVGREVDWFGVPALVVGGWAQPTYALQLSDGTRVTVGQDKVRFLAEPDEREEDR